VLLSCPLLLPTKQEQRAELWDNSNVLAIICGASSDDLRYLRSISLHLWLFGYEVTGACTAAAAAAAAAAVTAAAAAAAVRPHTHVLFACVACRHAARLHRHHPARAD
jgi:nucleosome binding factor SPN SPT16 subunit